MKPIYQGHHQSIEKVRQGKPTSAFSPTAVHLSQSPTFLRQLRSDFGFNRPSPTSWNPRNRRLLYYQHLQHPRAVVTLLIAGLARPVSEETTNLKAAKKSAFEMDLCKYLTCQCVVPESGVNSRALSCAPFFTSQSRRKYADAQRPSSDPD
jgi:hypothetical protein